MKHRFFLIFFLFGNVFNHSLLAEKGGFFESLLPKDAQDRRFLGLCGATVCLSLFLSKSCINRYFDIEKQKRVFIDSFNQIDPDWKQIDPKFVDESTLEQYDTFRKFSGEFTEMSKKPLLFLRPGAKELLQNTGKAVQDSFHGLVISYYDFFQTKLEKYCKYEISGESMICGVLNALAQQQQKWKAQVESDKKFENVKKIFFLPYLLFWDGTFYQKKRCVDLFGKKQELTKQLSSKCKSFFDNLDDDSNVKCKLKQECQEQQKEYQDAFVVYVNNILVCAKILLKDYGFSEDSINKTLEDKNMILADVEEVMEGEGGKKWKAVEYVSLFQCQLNIISAKCYFVDPAWKDIDRNSLPEAVQGKYQAFLSNKDLIVVSDFFDTNVLQKKIEVVRNSFIDFVSAWCYEGIRQGAEKTKAIDQEVEEAKKGLEEVIKKDLEEAMKSFQVVLKVDVQTSETQKVKGQGFVICQDLDKQIEKIFVAKKMVRDMNLLTPWADRKNYLGGGGDWCANTYEVMNIFKQFKISGEKILNHRYFLTSCGDFDALVSEYKLNFVKLVREQYDVGEVFAVLREVLSSDIERATVSINNLLTIQDDGIISDEQWEKIKDIPYVDFISHNTNFKDCVCEDKKWMYIDINSLQGEPLVALYKEFQRQWSMLKTLFFDPQRFLEQIGVYRKAFTEFVVAYYKNVQDEHKANGCPDFDIQEKLKSIFEYILSLNWNTIKKVPLKKFFSEKNEKCILCQDCIFEVKPFLVEGHSCFLCNECLAGYLKNAKYYVDGILPCPCCRQGMQINELEQQFILIDVRYLKVTSNGLSKRTCYP